MKPPCHLLITLTVIALTSTQPVAAETWVSIAPLPEPNAGFAAGWVNGKLVIAGGTNWPEGVKRWLNKTWVYNPGTNQWTPGPDLPHPLAYGAGASDGQQLWIAGGADGKMARNEVLALTKEGSWQHVGTMNHHVAFSGGAFMEGSLWIYGGTPDPDDWKQVTTALSSVSTSGKASNENPLRREGPGIGLPAVVGSGRKVYAFTGAWMSTENGQVQNSAEAAAYDIASKTWTKLDPYPVSARGVAAVALDDQHIYLAGGYGTDEQGFLDAAWIHDVRTQQYRKALPLPIKALVCLVKGGDGFIYVLGGEDQKKHRSAACFRIPVAALLKEE
ncbi:Kelch repeat-containing protein [Verrucomicrobium spinosum]|uniref:Kelch repeat-containing protein n=1 Tax=Verrucomicrobium spinosum TaxID=2736 RepID=UPI0001745280|nr:kelch repeat-containing protein [Verrucomicrobium spinosum]